MYCSKCGALIPDGVNICPNCGQNPVDLGENFRQSASNMFNNAEKQLGSALNDVHNSFNGYSSNITPVGGERLQDDRSLLVYIVLSVVTFGIYSWFWQYDLANRLAANAPRYGMNFQENGTTVLMWVIFGSFVCMIGPFVAMNILIKNSNQICHAYNRQHGYM